MKSTERFSDRVENYVNFRPSYPAELIALLAEQCHLSQDTVIADVGAGTGKLTELLLPTNSAVYAIEPNTEMREAAENLLKQNNNFMSMAGDSAATGLANDSVDLIVAAQAFHWFEPAPTRQEFARILKPAGYVGLIWNERDTRSGFQQAYDKMLSNYCEEYSKVNHRNISLSAIQQFFNPNEFTTYSFAYSQDFNIDGFLGRMYSSSYTPAQGTDAYAVLNNAARQLFQQHAVDNRIEFTYQTNLYLSKFEQ